jgi:GT2 family glycosyltransferase/glycosyltransferase involved in cell wall biosynthesis
VLDIVVGGAPAFSQLLPAMARDGARTFSFECPQLTLGSTLDVSIRGVPLLGSGSCLPGDFMLDGRTDNQGRRVVGWARLGWLPHRPLRLRIEDEHLDRARPSSARVPQPGWRWPFQIDLRAAAIRGQRLQISARLPDGRWRLLPDAPLLLERAVRLAGSTPARLSDWSGGPPRARRARVLSQNQRRTDVIIPVYRGREQTLSCIDAVLATVDATAQVVVVDDAADDPALVAALDALAADDRITLLRNADNQGFVASVNRAAALNPTHDVVLLNSDTRVFDDWLPRLRAAAYSGSAVGTVTPLSNSGTIASYPRAQGAPINPDEGAALHALASSTHSGTRVAVPVGVGFCLYVRRDCLSEVGEFDAAVFGHGYGEETDFCLRAHRAGWSHRLAADVFVYHAGGLSFGARRAALLERSARLINMRHPGYDRFIASFLARDALHGIRRGLDERRLAAFEGKFVLLVTLALAGGVSRFVDERCRGLREQGLWPLILRPAQAGNARRCELWTDALTAPNLRYNIPAELPGLTALLGTLHLQAIEIQHFLDLDARVIDAVRALSIPYDVVVHDYSWICPRVTLIDGSGRYCGEPAVSVCNVCVRRNGTVLENKLSVPALRARSATWLRSARRVVAPSADAATRLRRHFDGLQVDVQPHATVVATHARPARTVSAAKDGNVRIGLLGAIGDHKGYSVLLACARDARARRLPLEFVVIGYSHDDAALHATGKVSISGRYGEDEATYLLRREQPDIAWFPSVWPETWCYTLDYALQAGLPVAAFDLGAIAERVRGLESAMLMPLELTAAEINDRLLALGTGAQLPATTTASRSVQTPLPRLRDEANINTKPSTENSMTQPSNGQHAQEVQEARLSASVQVLPLPPGLYLFSVRSAGPLPASQGSQLSVPAVHVGLGPGVRSSQVEFVAGPKTEGAWLFAPGDLLVTKIIGEGATLILTSVRAPGGELLSIAVERLDGRTAAATATQQPVAAQPVAPKGEATESQPVAVPPRARPNGSARPRTPLAQKNSAKSAKAGKTGKSATADAGKPAAPAAAGELPLPLQIGAHIRQRGDLSFADAPWAGRVAPGLWIESFSVRPLQGFGPQDIEYKGLTGSGFETPWVSDDKMCGTKGMATPLVGFAVRLKPSPTAAAYDCEYSGYFASGVTIGPLRNGAPCRSTVANDPLEGIQLRLVRRSMPAPPPAARVPSPAPAVAAKHTGSSAATVKLGKRDPMTRRIARRSERQNRRISSRRP